MNCESAKDKKAGVYQLRTFHSGLSQNIIDAIEIERNPMIFDYLITGLKAVERM